jgi:hypothetical protein
VPDELAFLAYQAALRSLDKQEQLLADVRARTATLLAVSAIAASLIGGPVLDHPHPTSLVIVAVIAFGVSVASGISIIVPHRDLVFALSGVGVYEGLYDLRADMAEVNRRLAYDLDRYWDQNDRILTVLVRALRIAAIAVGTEILCLLIVVTGTLV